MHFRQKFPPPRRKMAASKPRRESLCRAGSRFRPTCARLGDEMLYRQRAQRRTNRRYPQRQTPRRRRHGAKKWPALPRRPSPPSSSASLRSSSSAGSSASSAEAKKNPYSALDVSLYGVPGLCMAGAHRWDSWPDGFNTRPAFFCPPIIAHQRARTRRWLLTLMGNRSAGSDRAVEHVAGQC